MQTFRAIVVLVPLLLGVVNAAPVKWSATFTGPVLGANAGTFTYDSATNQLTSWGIYGFDGPSCPGGPPCGLHGVDISANGEELTFWSQGSATYSALILDLAFPINSGQPVIPLLAGSCVICSGPGFQAGSTDSGSGYVQYDRTTGNGIFDPILGGNVTNTPEPSMQAGTVFLLFVMAWRIKATPHR